jgi:SH3-like domain-containing protein
LISQIKSRLIPNLLKFDMCTFFRKQLLQILVIGFFLFYSSTLFAAQFITVAKDNVNVRTGPSTDNPVHMQLFEGYPLKVLDKKGSWYKVVDFENDSGWIENSLTRSNNTVIVDAKTDVNMRSKPDVKSDIVATVDRGVVLEKIGIQGDWIEVRHSSGVTGWIYGKLLWP